MKIVVLSDTHGLHRNVKVPDSDLLIFCGDITMSGEFDVIDDFNKWLGELPNREKIVIAGNHDMTLYEHNDRFIAYGHDVITNAIYLENSDVEIDGYTFYGSPYSPSINGASEHIYRKLFGFNASRDIMRDRWGNPQDADVLITHSPPFGILDIQKQGFHVGDEALTGLLPECELKYHFFGHIHEAYGTYIHENGTVFANTSVLNENYKLTNKPMEFYID